MPDYVVKRAPDADEYMVWSTVVDSAVTPVVGRDELVEWLVDVDERKEPYARPDALARLERADRQGSSSRLPHHGWWDDDVWILPDQSCTDREGAFAYARANVRWEDDHA